MGNWHYLMPRPKVEHIHDYPKSVHARRYTYVGEDQTHWSMTEDILIGDIWRCECDKFFKVVDIVLYPDDKRGISDHYRLTWVEVK